MDAIVVYAVELSRARATRFLARSLDVMHVAAAQLLGCRTFVSADDRQLAVTRAAGLRPRDINRPKRGTKTRA